MWTSDTSADSGSLAGAPATALAAAPVAEPAPTACEAKKPANVSHNDWVTRYVTFLHRAGRFILPLIWLLLFIGGIVALGPVFNNLKIQARALPWPPPRVLRARFAACLIVSRRAPPQVEPIRGDANHVAAAALRGAFPRVAASQTMSVLLRCAGGCARSSPGRDAATRLVAAAAPYITDGLLLPSSGASYYTYADAGLAGTAATMLSPDGGATEIRFVSTVGATVTPRYRDLMHDLRAVLRDALDAAPAGSLQGGITGALVINADSAAAVAQDIATSDGATVSVSFLLLAAALRSLRLVALTAAALAAAFGAAFLLTWPLSATLSTPNFTTSLLISTLVSLSLDYSLFLLSHFKRSAQAGVAPRPAVEAMLRSGGHTVLVSGATLAACFLVLAILPVSIVRAPGIAATFAVVCSVAANLTLTPALLLCFPGFFGGKACCCFAGSSAVAPTIPAGSAAVELPPADADTIQDQDAGVVARFWAALAAGVQRYRWSLAVVITALLICPFAYRLSTFDVGQEARSALPRGAPAAETLAQLQADFGPGHTAQARLLGVASPTGGNAMSPQFFASASKAITGVLAASAPTALTAADVSGLAWSAGAPANAAGIAAAAAAVAPCPADDVASCRAACSAAACSLRLATASTVSPDGRAMIVFLNLRLDRTSTDGVAWANAARDALAAANEADPAGVTWHLLVDAAPDSIAYVYARLGTLVGVTAAVVFSILFAAFRSIAIAGRAVATLAVMEVCVFGTAAAIYCRGVLEPGGVLRSFSSDGGLFWLIPLLAFSLVTGLGLDYDIFLLSAVTEARHAGWSDADALTLGLRRSGPVISWAGVIMAVAFSGFLFSHIPLLNQLGFFIVYAARFVAVPYCASLRLLTSALSFPSAGAGRHVPCAPGARAGDDGHPRQRGLLAGAHADAHARSAASYGRQCARGEGGRHGVSGRQVGLLEGRSVSLRV
jgi:uncharacterized membrane protein YdfJ with MMPL/SSD domain